MAIVQSKKNANAGYWNYADSFTYTAAGAVSSMQLGNGKWESIQFNSRLQPTRIALGTVQNGTDKLCLDFDYGTWENGLLNFQKNNGNVAKQTITVPAQGSAPGFMAVQKYEYDSLSRLQSATENIDGNQTPSWKQTYAFDRYGNRRFDTANTTTLPAGCLTAVCNPTIDPATNRLIGYTFDNAGNTQADAENRTFIYDAENKQVEVKDQYGTSIGKYFFDGDGKRVKKISATETTIFVYDASGQLVAEYSTQISQTPQVSYLTSDHLGSPRINTDANGIVIARHDFQPFGEEIQRASYGADDVRQKFTTYERDKETSLDFAQARYHNYRLGRYQIADPENAGAELNEAQSWNAYVYVRNNPLNLVDPLGLSGDCPGGKCPKECPSGKICWLNEELQIVSVEDDNDPVIIHTSEPAWIPHGSIENNRKTNDKESINARADSTSSCSTISGNLMKLGNCIAKCMNDARVDKLAKAIGDSTSIPYAGEFLEGLTWVGTGAAIGNQVLNSTSLGKYPSSPVGGAKTRGHPTSWQHRAFGVEGVGGALRRAGMPNAARLSGFAGRAIGRAMFYGSVGLLVFEGAYTTGTFASCSAICSAKN